MRQNEKKWLDWYKAKTGIDWVDRGEAALEGKGLSLRQRALGNLLYQRYIKEKQNALAKDYDLAAAAQATDSALRNMAVADRLRAAYSAETDLALGQAHTGAAEMRERNARQRYRRDSDATDRQALAQRDALWQRYVAAEQSADATLQRDQQQVNNYYDRLDGQVWRSLRTTMQRQLANNYTEEGSRGVYTTQGIDAMYTRIRENRYALATKYDEALQWLRDQPGYAAWKQAHPEAVDALDALDARTDGADDGAQPRNGDGAGSTQQGGAAAGSADQLDEAEAHRRRMAAVVTYKKGAGSTINPLDVITVNYRGDGYTLRPKAKVNEGQRADLTTLANDSNMALAVGTTLYTDGRVYIYDGKGNWYSTTNAFMGGNGHDLEQLLRRIAQDN